MSLNIKFGQNRPETIFSDIAKEAAQIIKSNHNSNKTTQLRKFYDELSMWNERVQSARISEQKEAEYKRLEPFIKMLKAKVAYAQARKHINTDFSSIFEQCINQVNSAETLREAKLFMEAVMGYCKLFETK